MFCHNTRTWRGKPLVSRITVVDLIAATTTKTGSTVRCEPDEKAHAEGIKGRSARTGVDSTSRRTRFVTPSRSTG